MKPSVESGASPDEHIHGHAHAPKRLIRPPCTAKGLRCSVRDHDHDIQVAILIRIAACGRTEEIYLLWRVYLDKSPNHFAEFVVLVSVHVGNHGTFATAEITSLNRNKYTYVGLTVHTGGISPHLQSTLR